MIRRSLNGETRLYGLQSSISESIAYGREPGELKHLSTRRKRKKHEKDPGRGVKENLKPCVYKLWEDVKVRPRTFCRTVRRVTFTGVVKYLRYGAEVRASMKSACNQ